MQKVNGARTIFSTENVLTEEQIAKYKDIVTKKRAVNSTAAVDYLVNEM